MSEWTEEEKLWTLCGPCACCRILIHDGVVLLMVTVETVVPALFRSLTRSSRVVLGWSLTFLNLEFLQFSNNCTNSCCLLTKLFACCPVAHPSLVQVYNFVPSVLRQLFGLAYSGEVGVWLIECLNRCLLYRWVQNGAINTGNEWRIGGLLKDKLTSLWEPEFLLIGRWSFAPLYI